MTRQTMLPMDRRTFCAALGSTLAAVACSDEVTAPPKFDPDIPRLHVRPTTPTETITPGFYQIRDEVWTSLLLVPQRYMPHVTMPLVVALHGAGGDANEPINLLGPYAEKEGFILLAPKSNGGTWDGVEGIYGPDISTVDAALRATFRRCNVDARRICLEGFSDGASYALGVGITNPEVFSRVVAFSPGFVPNSEVQPVKRPLFISHGRDDFILPIDTASRVIVPELRSSGYDVTYLEFDGNHTVPQAVAEAAVQFMLAG
jgi:phospholipase/carboxylesterase